MRGARLAREIWKDAARADKLERNAADLKRRFNRDFWVEDGGYLAIALDQDGQVDSLASSNGHLLWSGIVDKTKAKAVSRHLLGQRLFSGWGVRTLAAGEGRYNPIGYHTGPVWPFDNSLSRGDFAASIGHLELLDIPGRWGRIDAFGRGRVETGRARARPD